MGGMSAWTCSARLATWTPHERPLHEVARLRLDLAALELDPQDLSPNGGFTVDDLISGESWEWGEYNYVRLDSHLEPAHILSVRRMPK